jgi:hypothetical protein
MLSLFFLVAGLCTLLFWVFFVGTPFISILFLVAISAALGFFLISVDLGFAGAVLIIVNAGALAMVFLFVCVLARRETVVARKFSSHYVLPVCGVFFVFLFLFSSFLNFFIYNNLSLEALSSTLLAGPSSVGLRVSDASLASHLSLVVYHPQ